MIKRKKENGCSEQRGREGEREGEARKKKRRKGERERAKHRKVRVCVRVQECLRQEKRVIIVCGDKDDEKC